MGGYDAHAVDQLCVYPVPNITQPRLKCREISSEEQEGSSTLRGPWKTSKTISICQISHCTMLFIHMGKDRGGNTQESWKNDNHRYKIHTSLREERRRK